MSYSAISPAVSVNQRRPAGPEVIGPYGVTPAAYSCGGFWGEGAAGIAPSNAAPVHVYQIWPSAPRVTPTGAHPGVSVSKSWKAPVGVIRPILSRPVSANQRLPSAPTAMSAGCAPAAIGNSLSTAARSG